MEQKTNLDFVIKGKVFAGNESHAKHSLFWAIRTSEWDGEIFIDEIRIEREKNGKE